VEIFKRLGHIGEQVDCLDRLARLLLEDDQLDAAEDTVLQKVGLLPEKGEEYRVCQSHCSLGEIYYFKGEKEKAIHSFETALGIASPFNWQRQLFQTHHSMAQMFSEENEFNDANAHTEQAKLHTADSTHNLGQGTELQARIWYRQGRLEDARVEALCTLGIYERLGAAKDVGICRELLREIEEAIEGRTSARM